MAESRLEREIKDSLNKPKFKRKKIEKLIKQLLQELGDDPNRPGLVGTPGRVARMYEEVLEGQRYTNDELVQMFDVCFEKTAVNTSSLVVEKDITAFSMCEHHLALMYDMKVSVGYIPNGKVIGLSKLNRIVDLCAKRLQLQEKLCEDIAYVVSKIVGTEDVAVFITGKHACVTSRGIKDTNASTSSSVLKGRFMENASLRAEFLSLIK
jgi:GTP cyclohydrolase I